MIDQVVGYGPGMDAQIELGKLHRNIIMQGTKEFSLEFITLNFDTYQSF